MNITCKGTNKRLRQGGAKVLARPTWWKLPVWQLDDRVALSFIGRSFIPPLRATQRIPVTAESTTVNACCDSMSTMFNALNRFISRLDGDDPRNKQSNHGGFGFQVLRNTNLELAIEPWFDYIVGINGRMIVRLETSLPKVSPCSKWLTTIVAG